MAKVPLAKHNDMIQAIPPDRADQSLRISVLPRRSCRSRPVTNAHRMKAAGKNVAVARDRNSAKTADQINLQRSLIRMKYQPIRRRSSAAFSLR